ncbi:MAG: hypothetical protein IKE27_08260 [Oscillospiraceae bacterium]|nr:hypothetical protein [Oscillospiraceae bacterium]
MANDFIQSVIDDIVTSNLEKIYGNIEIYRDSDDIVMPEDEEFDETADPVIQDQNAETEPAPPAKLISFRSVFGIMLAILIAVLGINAYISEFWVPAYEDPYTYPAITQMEPVSLEIGSSYSMYFPVHKNEEIKKIMNMDPDVITTEGLKVTATGEYFAAKVMIITGEVSVPEMPKRYSGVIFLGKDISSFLNEWRESLREFLKVEERPQPRTELRDLAVYEFTFNIKGVPEDPEPEDLGLIYSRTRQELEIELNEGEVIESVVSSDGEVLEVTEETDENGITHYYIEGLSSGEAEVRITIGHIKTVDGSTYRDYLEQQENGN